MKSLLSGLKGTVTTLPEFSKRMLTRATSLVTSGLGVTGDGEDRQPNLPKLPVPELEKTLQRYLEAIQPIITPEEYARVQDLARQLAESSGVDLQHQLLERQIKMKNWAYDWWLCDMYMNNALCLPINSNPGHVWPSQVFSSLEDQLHFASRLTSYMMDFKDILDRNDLPIEKATSREPGQPFCMAQHYRLMSSCRIPCLPSDYRRDTSMLNSDHIIVAYRKHLFTCPVKTPERRLTTTEIYNQFKAIVISEMGNNDTPVGILSSQARPIWADARTRLLGADINKQSVEEIETCNFIVCLDDPLPSQYFNCPPTRQKCVHWANDRDETNMLHQMLHGGGSVFNTGNRWFDKTIQFVVTSDGAVGLCYEHSPAEGIGIMNIIDEFLGKLQAGKVVDSVVVPAGDQLANLIPLPMKLVWELSNDTKNDIVEASLAIDRLIEDFDLMVFRYDAYGKDFIKNCKCSPDVYIQLGLQLAYFSLHGKMVATYESASTRRFKLGRVDCIRATHMEALDWCNSMVAMPNVNDPSERLRKFHLAVEKQTTVMTENILGEGVDVHLMGLRQQAIEMGMEVPKIFQDETFKIANQFKLSTSQLPTKQDHFMGYGAVVKDGYGASYNPKQNSIVFCLASFISSPATSTDKFSMSIKKSFDAMKQLLEQ